MQMHPSNAFRLIFIRPRRINRNTSPQARLAKVSSKLKPIYEGSFVRINPSLPFLLQSSAIRGSRFCTMQIGLRCYFLRMVMRHSPAVIFDAHARNHAKSNDLFLDRWPTLVREMQYETTSYESCMRPYLSSSTPPLRLVAYSWVFNPSLSSG